MEYRIPHYFEQFRCIAAECEDTCCAGWAIMIDDASLERYEKLEGAFGERLRNSIDWKEGSFCQYNKRCAFLNEQNLCDLHLEAGEDMLCDTCKNYPRHMEEFEGLREGSLSLSCIEAAKIILGCKEPVEFLKMEDDIEDEEYEEFDYLLFTKLMDAREKMLQMMQRRDVDIMVRIGMVLRLAEQMQKAVDDNQMFMIDDALEAFGKMDELIDFQQESEQNAIGENEYCSHMRKIFRTLYKLEVLKADWPELVKHAEVVLYAEGQRVYEDKRQRFHKSIGLKSSNYDVWACWVEQLVVYFIFTYFCGAVYDEEILAKIQTAILATILITELSIAKWSEDGEDLSFEGFVDIAHRVSRELEHSDVNLLRVEKICRQMAQLQPKELQRVLYYPQK